MATTNWGFLELLTVWALWTEMTSFVVGGALFYWWLLPIMGLLATSADIRSFMQTQELYISIQRQAYIAIWWLRDFLVLVGGEDLWADANAATAIFLFWFLNPFYFAISWPGVLNPFWGINLGIAQSWLAVFYYEQFTNLWGWTPPPLPSTTS